MILLKMTINCPQRILCIIMKKDSTNEDIEVFKFW